MTLSRTSGSIKETLLRHVETFTEGDLDAIMTDYCEDAVLLTPDGTLRKRRYKGVLQGIPGSLPARLRVEGVSAYVVWSGKSAQLDIPFATETSIIREGGILAQTFAAQMEPSLDTAGRQHK